MMPTITRVGINSTGKISANWWKDGLMRASWKISIPMSSAKLGKLLIPDKDTLKMPKMMRNFAIKLVQRSRTLVNWPQLWPMTSSTWLALLAGMLQMSQLARQMMLKRINSHLRTTLLPLPVKLRSRGWHSRLIKLRLDRLNPWYVLRKFWTTKTLMCNNQWLCHSPSPKAKHIRLRRISTSQRKLEQLSKLDFLVLLRVKSVLSFPLEQVRHSQMVLAPHSQRHTHAQSTFLLVRNTKLRQSFRRLKWIFHTN